MLRRYSRGSTRGRGVNAQRRKLFGRYLAREGASWSDPNGVGTQRERAPEHDRKILDQILRIAAGPFRASSMRIPGRADFVRQDSSVPELIPKRMLHCAGGRRSDPSETTEHPSPWPRRPDARLKERFIPGRLLGRMRKRSKSYLQFRCAPVLQLASLNSCRQEQIFKADNEVWINVMMMSRWIFVKTSSPAAER